MEEVMKWGSIIVGGGVGWFIEKFEPAFPLGAVAVILIIYDAWTAYQLDRRVHIRYPEKTQRRQAKFTSFAFGKVITVTIPKRLWLIIMAYMVERWVFVHVHIPLSYIVTGAICFEQFWSILENEGSCRDNDGESRFWRTLQRLLVDKTARHFDIDPESLKGYDKEQNMED
jgi:undecaprenyl pyrophosphate phosphatase UppP